MSFSTFNALWEESKAAHHADSEARASEFRNVFEKTWSLLWRPFFYVMIPLILFPQFRRRFTAERSAVRAKIARIVAEYVPKIRAELVCWEEGFIQWEAENRATSPCGRSESLRKENGGRDRAKKLSAEMLELIGAIPQYNWHFHPIENPAMMVENPYPGFLTSQRARNYCDCLVQAFN